MSEFAGQLFCFRFSDEHSAGSKDIPVHLNSAPWGATQAQINGEQSMGTRGAQKCGEGGSAMTLRDRSEAKRPPGRPSKRKQQQSVADGPVRSDPVISTIAPAAERRRTQVRLAQRAYRMRKENTLSSLQKQVGDIDHVVKDMNNAFVALNMKLSNSGLLTLRPDLSQELQKMTQGFESLAKLMSVSENEEQTGIQSTRVTPISPEIATISDSTSQHSSGGGALGPESVPHVLGELLQIPDMSDPSSTYPTLDQSALSADDQQNQMIEPRRLGLFTNHSDGVAFPITVPSPRYLKASSTYSFHETSFARRFHRICIESAYRLLTDPSANPARKMKTFKFAYRIWSHDHLIEKFRHLRSLAVDENLNDWSLPVSTVGGPGTHYPHSRDGDLRTLCGPLPLHLSHIQHDEKNVPEIAMVVGLDGEWFDPYDLEGYLRDMGVILKGHTSFFEMPASIDMGNSQMHPINNQLHSSSLPGYSPIIVDVEMLINRLLAKAVCLGHGPAVRRSDVETELFLAIAA